MSFFSKMVALQIGVTMLALTPMSASAQTPAKSTATQGSQSIQAAIAESTITIKGKQYPAPVRTGLRSSSGASCQLGDTMNFSHVAELNLASPMHEKTSWTSGPTIATYSPPNSDYVINTYNRVVSSRGAPETDSDSAYPAGYSNINSGFYNAISSTMHSYVASLAASGSLFGMSASAQASLNAQINTYISNYQAYSSSIGGSNSSVTQTAQVWGAGKYNLNVGHSWYNGWFNGSLICAPAWLHNQAAIESQLKSWVQHVVSRYNVLQKANAQKAAQ
jgi:hypothetical protein